MVQWDEFEKSSTAEWLKKINLDFNGKRFAEEIKYVVGDQLECSPFLTKGDIPPVVPLSGPKTKFGVEILHNDPSNANLKAKSMLSYGAEALYFDIYDSFDITTLFEGIYLDMISVIMHVKGNIQNVNKNVDTFLKDRYKDKPTNIILFSTEDIINKGILLKKENSYTQRLQSLKNYFENLSVNQSNFNKVIILELKKDFLAQIAELRAIRRFSEQFKKANPNTNYTFILITKIQPEILISEQIHPLIVCNYMLMSSYLGMSDFSFGLPYDKDEEIARLCLNIQHILKEESHLDYVSDPVTGSYIIEKITEQMSCLLQ